MIPTVPSDPDVMVMRTTLDSLYTPQLEHRHSSEARERFAAGRGLRLLVVTDVAQADEETRNW